MPVIAERARERRHDLKNETAEEEDKIEEMHMDDLETEKDTF